MKYRSFQYRLINRAVSTNIHLFRWGIKESAECTFCDHQQETYYHLFYECSPVQDLIQYMCSKWGDDSCNPTYKNVILNSVHENPKHVVNCVCVILKQYVYRTRCLGEQLSRKGLDVVVSECKNFEKYYAVKDQRLYQYNKKWCGGDLEEYSSQMDLDM